MSGSRSSDLSQPTPTGLSNGTATSPSSEFPFNTSFAGLADLREAVLSRSSCSRRPVPLALPWSERHRAARRGLAPPPPRARPALLLMPSCSKRLSGAWFAACASVLAGARSVAAARRPRLPVLMMLSWPTGRCLALPPSCFPSLLLSSRIILHLLPFHPFCLHLAAVWTAPNALGVWDMHGGAATFG